MNFRKTALSCAAGLVALGAIEVQAVEPIDYTPFHPTLIEDNDLEICRRFQSAWQQVYSGTRELRGQWLDLEASFPGAKVHPFPGEPHPRTGLYNGLFDFGESIEIDTNGDGKRETLYVEGVSSHGWRYVGVDINRIKDPGEIRTMAQALELGQKYSFRARTGQTFSRPLLPAGDVVYVFEYEGRVYATSGPNKDLDPVPLYQLGPDPGSNLICRVSLTAKGKAFTEFLSSLETYRLLQRMYGGARRGCELAHYGQIGWSGNSMPNAASRILNRPQSVDVYATWPEDLVALARAEREFRLMQWGTSDPVSWSVYIRLKADRQDLIDRLAEYYRTKLDLPDGTDFNELAERNYFYLVDMTTYSGGVINLKGRDTIWGQGFSVEAVSPRDMPNELLRVAAKIWLELERGKYSDRSSIWQFAATAAAYTGQDAAFVRTFWSEIERRYEKAIAKKTGDSAAFLTERFRGDAQSLFLATLGNPELRDFALTLDVDVNKGTNWFGKTALMYAAQMDDLSAVEFLLRNGADLNVATRADPDGCGDLERDQRTALMYAAENASAELIEMLLDAGADKTAKDSWANTISWYLSRNKGLGVAARQRIRDRLEK